MKKTLVILANSVKHSKHCVAGKDISTKEWIRPVSTENGAELSKEQVFYNNKNQKWKTKPLDKIEIEFEKKCSLVNQPENYLIASKEWVSKYKIQYVDLKDYKDTPSNLWLDGESSNEKVKYKLIEDKKFIISQSLYFIFVDKIHIYWKERPKPQQKQRRGKFTYNKIEYDLPLTDPEYSSFEDKDLEKKYLCVSLGEVFEEYCYKIIASIL